jgi:hypothetical protein
MNIKGILGTVVLYEVARALCPPFHQLTERVKDNIAEHLESIVTEWREDKNRRDSREGDAETTA